MVVYTEIHPNDNMGPRRPLSAPTLGHSHPTSTAVFISLQPTGTKNKRLPDAAHSLQIVTAFQLSLADCYYKIPRKPPSSTAAPCSAHHVLTDDVSCQTKLKVVKQLKLADLVKSLTFL